MKTIHLSVLLVLLVASVCTVTQEVLVACQWGTQTRDRKVSVDFKADSPATRPSNAHAHSMIRYIATQTR
ncbi:hypothetical protein PoB_004990300 [Plakobranchus ocellatus]|uniref:Secreted protein n=1 Tax=Plakobranchus ocellatus TaxID=259542 RepID=A0AAV4BX74_9GAST|nr:hypothetical protein PoB_004990300 [Plakobranchus ocellatus]